MTDRPSEPAPAHLTSRYRSLLRALSVVSQLRFNADVVRVMWLWMCCVVLRMRGEAGGARGKAGGVRSGSNYPPISAAYWLPPSNPTPYHVPGSEFPFIHSVMSNMIAADINLWPILVWPWIVYEWWSIASYCFFFFLDRLQFFHRIVRFETESGTDIDRYANWKTIRLHRYYYKSMAMEWHFFFTNFLFCI